MSISLIENNGVIMFKVTRKQKNFINCNDLILKGMFKRRRLAFAAIAHVCDTKQIIRVVK